MCDWEGEMCEECKEDFVFSEPQIKETREKYGKVLCYTCEIENNPNAGRESK